MSVVSLGILIFLLINLSATIETMAMDLIKSKKEQTQHELDNFFKPVVEDIKTTIGRAEGDFYDSLTLKEFDKHFIPFIENSEPISSLMLANEHGDEKMLLGLDLTWINRHTFKGSEQIKADRYEWAYSKGQFDSINQWKEETDYDPRTRPWFLEAMQADGEINWTAPYTFFTTKDPGITASQMWINSHGTKHVFGFDLMLTDISVFTSNLQIIENGKVFILTDDDRVLGLPHDKKFNARDSMKANVLKPYSEIGVPVIGKSKTKWDASGNTEECYSFDHGGEKWWGTISEYQLGQNTLHIGVVAPESDFLAAIEQTRMMIIGGFVLIFLFTIVITRSYRQIRFANASLHQQKKIVEEKNTEILDSINYAKRIQSAILPTNKIINSLLADCFVLYKPKDVVSGDFYWMEKKGDTVLFAAADCTGHGVPGAMVSVICNSGLNRSVREFGLTEPGEILNKTRELVIKEFEKSEEEVKDGMDIALCSLNGSELKYAGANNPLWIIRKGSDEIEQVKADKQPIGKHENLEDFNTSTIQVNQGDLIYLFSDGYADQFGGDKGKKLKASNFKKLLLEILEDSMEEQMRKIDEAFESWKGELEQLDDVCVIGVRI